MSDIKYKGKSIDELSKEELFQALEDAYKQNQKLRDGLWELHTFINGIIKKD